MKSLLKMIVVGVLLAGCGNSTVVPSVSTAPSVSLVPEISPSPSPSSSDSPSPTPSDSPTASPSPSPSPTPLAPLAIVHCTAKAGRASSDTFFNTTKYFAGYLDSCPSKTVTCVEASWILPATTCAAGDSKSDMWIWVAIGGYDGHGTTGAHQRPEKVATEAYCYLGAPYYAAWTYSVQAKDGFHDAPFLPRAGDQIWAQVSASGHHFRMTIADLTQHQISSVTATVIDGTREDAQWMVESPEVGCPKKCAPLPLPKFSPLVFTGAEAIINGVLATVDRWPRQVSTMSSGSIRRATVSRLGRGTFTVTWRHS